MDASGKMTLGPVLIGIDGTTLSDTARRQLEHPLAGGVVLFTRNFENRAQLESLAEEIRAAREPRLLLAVDQEGGRVQRFREGFTRLPALGRLGEKYAEEPAEAETYAYWHGRVMALEMLDAGIDLSFAPVLDLDRGSEVIGDRAFSGTPATVVALGRAYLSGMHDAGMKTTGKHFPGHGSVAADSHLADVCDTREFTEIESSDLVPFTSLLGLLDAMMIAHVSYSCVDQRPAGYSNAWLGDRLRSRMGYKGVIFSDDLGMHAAKSLGDLAERTRACLAAGCDAALVCGPEDVAALLEQWGDGAPDATAGLQRLYGKPEIPPGSLRRSATDIGRDWARWRERLEDLN